jgi:hypothetical protein
MLQIVMLFWGLKMGNYSNDEWIIGPSDLILL